MKCLDAIEDKLQLIQPLEERVVALEVIVQNSESLPPQATLNQVDPHSCNQREEYQNCCMPDSNNDDDQGDPSPCHQGGGHQNRRWVGSDDDDLEDPPPCH
ncbi:hypothetical protein GUJ93_ZPchr0006g42699 [Zizania palustris]|uniref:Uncharacterized protein n=1 Tax=Zizania palustris TaxID=103762 RepID=A0A8J5T2K7_ZIZPA|nr:hypothetical protein GUJ93_ZPchr0006g42699 [Zizania palustris]